MTTATTPTATMTRAEIIHFITEASRRPRPAIVEKISYRHEPSGKVYPSLGLPLGIKFEDCERFVSGYAYQDANGTRYANKHYATAEEASDALDAADARHTAEIERTFSPMTDEELASQYEFWKKETERYSYKRQRGN